MVLKNDRKIGPYEWALLAVLLLNAGLKWKYFCGLVAADDFSYAVYAYSMWRIPMHWDMTMDFRVLRLALILPVALLLRILPPVVPVVVAYPMAISFGTIIMVYLIGKKLSGPNAGLLAAFIMATFPADVIYGTMLLPDGVVPFYISFAIWAFLNGDGNTGRKSAVWYAVSGLGMFLAFITRENTYYFLLFFLPFAFSRKRWQNGVYMFGAGFAVPVFLLYGFYYLKSGDFLFNLHVAEHYRDPLIASGYIPKNQDNWFVMLFFMLPVLFERVPGQRILMSSLFGLTMYIGIASIIYLTVKAVIRRDFKLLMPPWWFLVVYLLLDFGSVSFSHFQMMRKLDRFLLALTPAMAIACGVYLADVFGVTRHVLFSRKITKDVAGEFKKRKIRWIVAPLTLILGGYVLATSVEVLAHQKTSRDANLAKFRWGYFEILKDRPHKPVYNTGGWWENKFSFYFLPDMRYAELPWRHNEMIRKLKDVTDPSALAGSYVIIDRTHFSGQNDLRIRESYDEFGWYAKLPPKEWTLLGRSMNVEIYEVPDGWTPQEPDGKELVMDTLGYSMEIGDLMLFLSCLHPDLQSRLTEQQFSNLIRVIATPDDPNRKDLMENRLIYREFNGIMKIDFNLN